MILDSINNCKSVYDMHHQFQSVFKFLKTLDFKSLQVGKITPDGEIFFLLISESEGKTNDKAKLETHQKYIDIQIPIAGCETMGWRAKSKCSKVLSEYNIDKDIAFFDDVASTYIDVHEGEFIIFFPEDAHAPGIGEGTLRKIVVKIPV